MTFAVAGLLILLAILGTPIFIVIGAAAMYGFWAAEVPLSIMAVEIYRITDTPMLVALPLFSLSGYILAESGTPTRLVNLARAFFGWLPVELPIIALLTCAFFTAITGASGVTIVAIGALLYPSLRQAGYGKHFSLGLVTSSGSLGLLLAPSLPLILYGVIVQQMDVGVSIDLKDLFLAGLIPALLMVVLLTLWSIIANPHELSQREPFEFKRIKAALLEAKWELPLPVILLGGIYGGFFAISEVAAIAVTYVLTSQLIFYREVNLKQLPDIIVKSSVMVGSIILILAVSLAFTNVLVDAEIPMQVFEFIREHIHSKYAFLLALNIFLLLLGAILDIFSALMIMTPLMVPVALSYGIDPIHLGIIFLANMQIGYFTPPVGMNLFIASYRFKEPIAELYKATLPFFFVLLLAVILITYVPWFSLALVGN
jgi:tripartite ATP-independent transporter DctM subunit